MKKKLILLTTIIISLFGNLIYAANAEKTADYLILASENTKTAGWRKVVVALQKKHNCRVVYFQSEPREALAELRKTKPRYVAIVDLPERIGKEYIIGINQLSRQVNKDMYADFMWGVITGYNADAAMRMVKNSASPLVIESCVSTIKELESGKWFKKFAYVDDHNAGIAGEKKAGEEKVTVYNIQETIEFPTDSAKAKKLAVWWKNAPDLLGKFYNFYRDYDPDLLVTASHATEYNLEMPASLGFIRSADGVLYADFPTGRKNLVESGKRRVYLPIGNCLIANVNKDPKSMAPAFIHSARAAAMVGYVVPTWYGRAGWGALKYWLTTPGRYTLAQAVFLNQQDMLYQLNKWNANFTKIPFNAEKFNSSVTEMETALGQKPTKDQVGFLHDRDVLAYYGDPKWDVRLAEIPAETDFTVTQTIKGKKCVLTIKTKPGFSLERMKGDKFKEEHVLDLPFSYFFPQRLNNPKLAPGQKWKAAVDNDFILIYNAEFKAGGTYKIELILE